MKQIRFITHNDNHVDEETLINGVWAVTRCDCELTNAALLPDPKEIDMELLDIRECEPITGTKLLFCDVKDAGAILPHSVLFYEWADAEWEGRADALHDCLFAAQVADEAAEILDWLPVTESVQLAREPFPQDAEGCGNDYDDLRNFAIGR